MCFLFAGLLLLIIGLITVFQLAVIILAGASVDTAGRAAQALAFVACFNKHKTWTLSKFRQPLPGGSVVPVGLGFLSHL